MVTYVRCLFPYKLYPASIKVAKSKLKGRTYVLRGPTKLLSSVVKITFSAGILERIGYLQFYPQVNYYCKNRKSHCHYRKLLQESQNLKAISLESSATLRYASAAYKTSDALERL